MRAASGGRAAALEARGVLLDRQMLPSRARSSASASWKFSAKRIAKPVQPFNLDSPKQLCNILFEKMNLPVFADAHGPAFDGGGRARGTAESYPLPS